MSNVIAVAVETTGLDPYKNEIVRMSVYGNDGETDGDRLFGISNPDVWDKKAQEISGLTPDDVEGLTTCRQAVIDGDDYVIKAINDADIIVSHNMTFLASFLGRAGIDISKKRFGDTGKCFTNYAYSHKLMSVSHTLGMAARCMKVSMPRKAHTPDKAKVTYLVWLELVRRRYSRLMDINELRDCYRKRSRKTKAKKGKSAAVRQAEASQA